MNASNITFVCVNDLSCNDHGHCNEDNTACICDKNYGTDEKGINANVHCNELNKKKSNYPLYFLYVLLATSGIFMIAGWYKCFCTNRSPDFLH